MKKPKPPLGFVPVDSDEAKGIGNSTRVNYACVYGEVWNFGSCEIAWVRDWANSSSSPNYHVQLPPKVEWEDVWGWRCYPNVLGWCLTKNGEPYEGITESQLDAIVAALNKMEEGNG